MREGNESDIFWNALGGKSEYARGKEIKGYIEDPHLFMLSGTEGKTKFPVFKIFLAEENAVLPLVPSHHGFIWL